MSTYPIQNGQNRFEAEKALDAKHVQALLSSFINSTDDMIWSVDPVEFRLLVFNRGLYNYFQSQFGFTISTGMQIEGLFPTSEYRRIWRGYYERVLAEGDFTCDYVTYSGADILRFSFSRLEIDHQVVGIAVFGKNITAQMRAQTEILRQQERLKQAVRIAGLGIWEWDIATDQVTWDGEMFNIYGITPQAFTGKGSDYIQATRADYRERQQHNIASELEHTITEAEFVAGAKREYNPKELCIVRPDGSERYTLGDAVCISDSQGKPARMLGVTFDITAHIKMEQALRKSEASYRLIANNTADVIWTLNLATGRFTYVSPAVQKLLGFTPDEFIDQLMGIDMTPEAAERSLRKLQQRAAAFLAGDQSKRIATNQLDQRRKDGTYVPTEVITTIVIDEQGWPELVGVTRDITERRQAEQQLRGSEEKFRVLTEKSVTGIYIIQDAVMAYVNPRFADIFDYSPDQIIGRLSPRDLIHPDDIGAVMRRLAERIDGKSEPSSTTYKAIRQGGELIDIETFGMLIDYNGRPAVMGTLFDVTERNHALEALRESEALFRTSFENSMAGIVMADAEGRFIRVNQTFCDMVGYTRAELLQLRFVDITAAEDSEMSLQSLRRMNMGEIDSTSMEKRYVCKDGVVIWAFISVSAIRDKDNRFLYTVTYIHDITQQKQNEIDLKLSNINLRKAMESAIETIARIVEVRDPYTSGHQKRVAEIAVKVARDIGLCDDKVRSIYYAGLIHDLGKIQIPSEILSKPGQLSKLEYEMVKMHSEVAYEMLQGIEFPWPIAEIILQHHERMDGSGYPRKLSGDSIMIEARILAVADVVDAMMAHRPYRPALGVVAAVQEINQHAGTFYDTRVVEAVAKVISDIA